MMESWVPIKEWEDLYEVSSSGNVRSLDRIIRHWRGGLRTIKGRVLIPVERHEYLFVNLAKNGCSFCKSISRLVAIAFVSNPNNLPEVNHKKGIKKDNRASQLEWCTPSYNTTHAYENGLAIGPKGITNGQAKLTESQVIKIRKYLSNGALNQEQIGTIFNVSQANVSFINTSKTWKHI